MPRCKNCGSERSVRNGKVRGKQRYRCTDCRLNYVEGDGRTSEMIAARKAMLILLYSLGKASFNTLANLFDMWPSQLYRWVTKEGLATTGQEIPGELRKIGFDEMSQFVESKKTSFEASKHLIAVHGEAWPGCSVIVMLQDSGSSATK